MHKKATKKMGFKEAYKSAEGMESRADKKKEVSKAKKSMHKMPDGKMMKNSAMNKRSK